MRLPMGEKLRKLREKKKLTQAELAENCGLSESGIRSYELGARTPKEEHRKRIAEQLGIHPESIHDFGACDDAEIVHFLMQMEDDGSLEPILINGIGYVMPYSTNLEEAIQEWSEKHYEFISGKITAEEYQDWKNTYNPAGASKRIKTHAANKHFDWRKAKINDDRLEEEVEKLPSENDRDIARRVFSSK